MELFVERKRCFITSNSKYDVDEFVANLEKIISKIEKCNPYVSFIVGDFYAKNTNWWGNVNQYQGIQIDQISGAYGYSQIINEATNFEPRSEPSCFDLIFSSQPNLVPNSGTYASLFERCHHHAKGRFGTT